MQVKSKEVDVVESNDRQDEDAKNAHSNRATVDLDDEVDVTKFEHSEGLGEEDAATRLQLYGRNELVDKITPSWLIYMRGLWGPMPIAIWIAVIVEFALQTWIDGGILLGILFANASISWYETTKAGNAVAALKKSLKPSATVKRDGKWSVIDAALLVPGDLVLLGAGSAVPADCILHDFQLDIDEAALTGESLPVAMTEGHRPKMGSNVVRGEGEATVEFTGMNTFFGRTAALLQSVRNDLGGIQVLLVKVMVVLTSLSFVLCLSAFIYLLIHVEEPVDSALEFTVVLLVASIPIAIEIVVTTTLAAGSHELTKWKAIVTRLTAIEALAGMNMLCSDKTGTLTLNEMQIQEECPIFVEGFDRNKVMVYAALAAKWAEPPRDALDRMVLHPEFDRAECDRYKQLDYRPFDPTIKRTESTVRGPDGKEFKVTKGAPNIVMKLVHNRDDIAESVDTVVHAFAAIGTRCLSVARTNENEEWELLGILTFLDPARPDTKRTIELARANGVHVKMITGDHAVIAKEMGRRIGLGTNILSADGFPVLDVTKPLPSDLGEKYGAGILAADGFAQVYPEHKFMIVEALRQYGFTCGMTGDGVNDSPALKRADIGIAVSGATDAARAAADIVLTAPGLSVIIEAIMIARCVFNRIKSFMTYRIAATLQLLVFFFIAVFALPPSDYQPFDKAVFVNASNPAQGYQHVPSLEWPKFFSIPVLMLMLITLLNDGTLLTIGYDTVLPSKRPQKWNLPALFLIASVLAGVACLSSLILLFGALDSYNTDGWFHRWGLPPIEYPKIVTMMYLKVSISDFLTLFSSRAVENYFWSSKPANVLLIGAMIALSLSTILATLWPDGTTSGVPTRGLSVTDSYSMWPLWVWLYCLGWWIAQDLAKVGTYRLLEKYDIFKYRSSAIGLAFHEGHEDTCEQMNVADAAADHRKMALLESVVENPVDGQSTSNRYQTHESDV